MHNNSNDTAESRFTAGLRSLTVATAALLVSACAGPSNVGLSKGHVIEEPPVPGETPEIVAARPEVPEPVRVPPAPTYTVVVKQVPVIDLLFSLARDAELDLDLQSTSEGLVTINAVERPLPEILTRVTSQAGLRYWLRGRSLIVVDDKPYWKNYTVDYVNVVRNSEAEVGVATQIATTGGTVNQGMGGMGGAGGGGGGGGGGGQAGDQQGNRSKTVVRSTSENDFWAALKMGLMSAVNRLDEGASDGNQPIIINPMAGLVTVLGTEAQHVEVQTYLDQLLKNSKRQVLIEMTIVEVELNDNFQAGIDWSSLVAEGADGFDFQQRLLGPDLTQPPAVALNYLNTNSSGDVIQASLRMLQQFGDTQVLSSPKIMALNNQTALLKVVNESVYFNIQLDIRDATINVPERLTFTSQINTVPVGLVMSVTPQISDNGTVSLNVRPTISRIVGFAVDPAPRLAGADFDNLIPEIQVREIESLLQVMDGNTIVLGGLMQNEQISQQDGLPGLSKIPGVGKLFSYNRDRLVKTELVIFLKPTIIENATAPAGSPSLADYYDVAAADRVTSSVDYR